MAQQQPRNRASRIRVRVEPRRPIDLQRLGRAVIELAMHELQNAPPEEPPKTTAGPKEDL